MMRGHERLIELRKAGKAPKMVFINDWPCNTNWFENPGDAVTICTHGDDVNLADLRFLVNLKVSISSESEDRAKTLFNRAKESGAAMVAGCHYQKGVKRWEQDGWAQVWSKANG